MKKIIIANLFIILLTGIFLYGKDRHSDVTAFELFSQSVDSKYAAEKMGNKEKTKDGTLKTLKKINREMAAKLENYKLDQSVTLKYKKENEELSQEIIVLEKNNYRLLSFIASLKNEIKKKQHSKQFNHAKNKNFKLLAIKEYDLLKYKNKIIHANTIHAKLTESIATAKRSPASAPVADDFESEEYKIYSSTKHAIAVGEDLMKVSKDYYNTHSKWRLILKANPNINMNKLEVGQVLFIPNVAEEIVVWLDGKMMLKTDLPAERKPATIGQQEVE
jgi:hypothetical protein